MLIRNCFEVFSICLFRNYEILGVGNLWIWYIIWMIKFFIICRYWLILIIVFLIVILVICFVDFLICGFLEVVKIKIKKCMNFCFLIFYMFLVLLFVNSKDKIWCKLRRLNISLLNNDMFLIFLKCRFLLILECGSDWKIILN